MSMLIPAPIANSASRLSGTAPHAPATSPASGSLAFTELDPQTLLAALETLGLQPDGRLLALNSYENRVYQVWCDDLAVPLVVKFYRPGRWSDAQILEEHALLAELGEDDIPVVAPMTFAGATLHVSDNLRFAVFPRQRGRAPELDSADVRRQMGRFLARMHVVGGRERFAARPALDLNSFGHEPAGFLKRCGLVPEHAAAVYFGVLDQALNAAGHAWARAGDLRTIRLHGDCHLGNVLWLDGGPNFVDFDDARSGPAVQDLWMLLSGARDEQQAQLADLLDGYEMFRDFERSELHLIEALRTLRLIHYTAWLARRWDDPAFPAAFPWFASSRYWEDRILELREQIALLDEPPLCA